MSTGLTGVAGGFAGAAPVVLIVRALGRTGRGRIHVTPAVEKTMDLMSLTEGSPVKVLVRFGSVRSRIEDGVVTKVTEARLTVRSGGHNRDFVRSNGAGIGDDRHCRLVGDSERAT